MAAKFFDFAKRQNEAGKAQLPTRKRLRITIT